MISQILPHFLRLTSCRIFKVGTPFDKLWHNNPFLTGSLQSLESLPEARKRKEFLNPFFSKATIRNVERHLLRAKLDQFLETLQDVARKGNVTDFSLAFRCLTADTIMDYCFQQDLDALHEENFESATVKAFSEGFDMAIMATYFPNFFNVLNIIIFSLPEHMQAKYFAPVYGFKTMQRVSRFHALQAHCHTRNRIELT